MWHRIKIRPKRRPPPVANAKACTLVGAAALPGAIRVNVVHVQCQTSLSAILFILFFLRMGWYP